MTLALKETLLVAVGAFVSVTASVTANSLAQNSLWYIALILVVGVTAQVVLVRYDSEDERLLHKIREREFERLAIELNAMRKISSRLDQAHDENNAEDFQAWLAALDKYKEGDDHA